MHCTKCGKQANPSDRYCSGCGAKLGGDQPEKKKRSGNLLTVGIVAVILAVGAFQLFREKPQTLPEETLASPAAGGQMLRQTEPAETQAQPVSAEEPQTDTQLYLSGETRSEMGSQTQSQYRYDGKGRLISKDTGDGYSHTYSYRDDGTLAKEGIFFGNEPYQVIQYDKHGNPESESDLSDYVAIYENTYDSRDRLTESRKTDADGNLKEHWQYTYDRAGGYTLTYADYDEYGIHCRKTTAYDADGRILSVEQDLESGMPMENRTGNTYDGFGSLEQTEYIYDDGDLQIHQITDYVNTRENGLLVSAEVSVWEQQTLRGETTESPRKLERTILYTYDTNGRLLRQDVQGPDNGWEYSYTWEYDEQGNLLQYTEGNGDLVQTYSYLPLDEVS